MRGFAAFAAFILFSSGNIRAEPNYPLEGPLRDKYASQCKALVNETVVEPCPRRVTELFSQLRESGFSSEIVPQMTWVRAAVAMRYKEISAASQHLVRGLSATEMEDLGRGILQLAALRRVEHEFESRIRELSKVMPFMAGVPGATDKNLREISDRTQKLAQVRTAASVVLESNRLLGRPELEGCIESALDQDLDRLTSAGLDVGSESIKKLCGGKLPERVREASEELTQQWHEDLQLYRRVLDDDGELFALTYQTGRQATDAAARLIVATKGREIPGVESLIEARCRVELASKAMSEQQTYNALALAVPTMAMGPIAGGLAVGGSTTLLRSLGVALTGADLAGVAVEIQGAARKLRQCGDSERDWLSDGSAKSEDVRACYRDGYFEATFAAVGAVFPAYYGAKKAKDVLAARKAAKEIRSIVSAPKVLIAAEDETAKALRLAIEEEFRRIDSHMTAVDYRARASGMVGTEARPLTVNFAGSKGGVPVDSLRRIEVNPNVGARIKKVQIEAIENGKPVMKTLNCAPPCRTPSVPGNGDHKLQLVLDDGRIVAWRASDPVLPPELRYRLAMAHFKESGVAGGHVRSAWADVRATYPEIQEVLVRKKSVKFSVDGKPQEVTSIKYSYTGPGEGGKVTTVNARYPKTIFEGDSLREFEVRLREVILKKSLASDTPGLPTSGSFTYRLPGIDESGAAVEIPMQVVFRDGKIQTWFVDEAFFR